MPKNIETISADIEQALAALRPVRRHAAQNSGIYAQLDRAYQQHILNKLQAAIADNRNNPTATINKLKVILADNWTLVQNNYLCYTNNPDSAATKILCDIAEFIVAEQNEQGQSVISVLMPTVATVSTDEHESYPNLTNLDIKTILKTHILGREGAYLIPVTVITNYDEERGFAAIYNPYFDPFFEYNEVRTHKDDMVRLHTEEISRLAEHSPLSRTVCDAQKNYEATISQQSNLLGQIRLLLSQLQYNSVNGVGQEGVAGNAIYVPLLNFFAYYDALSAADRARVPRAVREALENIQSYASNAATMNDVNTCLAIRRSELRGAIAGQDVVLSGISLSGDTQEHLVADAKDQLEQAWQDLQESIASPEYTGKDSLGITADLLRHFNLTIPFNNIQDLDVLKTMSPADIESICIGEYPARIVQAIDSIENLVVLSLNLSPDKLQALLNSIGPQLIQQYFNDSKLFATTLMLLDQERRDIYWNQYKAVLPGLIKGAFTFPTICTVLTPAQRAELFGQLRAHKATALQSGLTLGVAELSDERLDRLHANLVNRLPLMNDDPEKFQDDFYWAYAIEFIKVAAAPSLYQHTLTPFKSKSAFFATALVAVACPYVAPVSAALALEFALQAIGFGILALGGRLLGATLSGNLYTYCALGCFALAVTLKILLIPLAILSATSLVTRSVLTAASYLGKSSESEEQGIDLAPEENGLRLVAP